MKLIELEDDLENFLDKDEAELKVSVCNKDNEEEIITVNNSYIQEDEGIVLDLFDYTSELLVDYETKIIQRCYDRVPKELQTKETADLIALMFDLKVEE